MMYVRSRASEYAKLGGHKFPAQAEGEGRADEVGGRAEGVVSLLCSLGHSSVPSASLPLRR